MPKLDRLKTREVRVSHLAADKVAAVAFATGKPASVIASALILDALEGPTYDEMLTAWVASGAPRRFRYRDPARRRVVPRRP